MNFLKRNIPSGWALKKMPDVVKWSSGGTPKATEKSYYENGTIPWLIIGDLNDGIVTSSASKITELGLQNSNAKMIPVGTLLVAMYGSIGKLGITGIECCTNQAIAYAKELKGVSTKYMYYYMAMMKSELISHGKGGTQKNISQTVLNSLEVLVPPEKEQERIVNKIEELFSELDSAVETLKKTKEQLAVYRQSVLECAFEGEYTIDWRKQNKYSVSEFKKELYKKRCDARNTSEYQLMEEISLPSIPKGWDWVFVGDIVTSPEYGTSKKSLKKGKIPVLRMGNMKNGSIDWDDLVYSNDEEDNKKYRLHDQDVLFNRTNSPEHVGKTSIFKGEQEAIFAGYIIRINQLPEINAQYLTYYMNSHTAKKYSNKVKTDGVNQSNINGKKLLSYPFPLCTRGEQDKIVDEIEIRLSKCDSIEKTVNDALIQANAMRQSILKKAFDGGL